MGGFISIVHYYSLLNHKTLEKPSQDLELDYLVKLQYKKKM